MTGCANLNLISQLNSYYTYLKETKKSSDNTFQAYRRDLDKFLEYALNANINDFSSVDIKVILDFKTYLSNKGLSSSSVSRTLSSLRSLFQFLVSEGICNENPAKAIHNDKTEKTDLMVLTSKEIEALLAQPDTSEIKGIRDKAMLELLYATGIKVSELINLNLSDFNAQLSFIRCGEADKERFIPLYPLAMKSVKNYIDKSRKLLINSDSESSLFVNTNGERLTRQGFWKILKAYASSAGINKTITPHTLRNSFAAHLLENGADIHDIQVILGHSDIASTQRYAQYLKEKMKNSYIKFHPRA